MSKHALLIRQNPERWARWHSQLAMYGYANVWFSTGRLRARDIGYGTPVFVMHPEIGNIVGWGETTGAVRGALDCLTGKTEDHGRGVESDRRVCSRLRRARVPFSAVQARPAIANLHDPAGAPATWLTEEQYLALLDLCRPGRRVKATGAGNQSLFRRHGGGGPPPSKDSFAIPRDLRVESFSQT